MMWWLLLALVAVLMVMTMRSAIRAATVHTASGADPVNVWAGVGILACIYAGVFFIFTAWVGSR